VGISLDWVLTLVGSAIIFFIPGWIWTYLFFDKEDSFGIETESQLIKYIERFVLAIALSLVLIPLSVFFLNTFLSIGSTLMDAILASIFPILLGALLNFAKKRGLLRHLDDLLKPD